MTGPKKPELNRVPRHVGSSSSQAASEAEQAGKPHRKVIERISVLIVELRNTLEKIDRANRRLALKKGSF